MSDNKIEALVQNKGEEHINSPEKLDAYLQVTKPSMWIVFGGVFLFVAAIIIWGALANIQITIEGEGYIQDGKAYVVIQGSKSKYIEDGQTIYINNEESVIERVIYGEDEEEEPAGQEEMNSESGVSVYVEADTKKANGYCTAKIYAGNVAPLSLLFSF